MGGESPGEEGTGGGQLVERGGDSTKVLDKSPVEVGEAEKSLELFAATRGWPFLHCLDLDRIGLELPLGDDKTQEADLRHMKLEFFWFDKQLVV